MINDPCQKYHGKDMRIRWIGKSALCLVAPPSQSPSYSGYVQEYRARCIGWKLL